MFVLIEQVAKFATCDPSTCRKSQVTNFATDTLIHKKTNNRSKLLAFFIPFLIEFRTEKPIIDKNYWYYLKFILVVMKLRLTFILWC